MQYVIHQNEFTPEVRAAMPKPIQRLLKEGKVVIASAKLLEQSQRAPELTATELLHEIRKLSA